METAAAKFNYKWWGKGDLDATFGVFFDGFSKIISAIGIMLYVFGMPASLVIGKIVPAIGVATFLGNLWYFYEAKRLAEKEKRHNVTAQPFGIGASQLTGWLFLIMGPVYWQTGDAMLAFRVGLTACFIGGLVEILGAFAGRWIVKHVPQSALLGNMASSALVWLSIIGMSTVFDKPEIAVLPLFIVIMDYIAKADRRFRKIPTGIIAIVIGSVIAWATGYMTWENFTSSFSNLGFSLPGFFAGDIFGGFGDVIPFLPIIIPLQINNFLTTLQGVESAKIAGDTYPERQSMIMDGVCTTVGSLLGNPFPTTVYFGHPGWKAIDAHAGYSLAVGLAYLAVCLTGLTGVIMAVVPYEVVLVLLIFVGLVVSTENFQTTDKRYFSVILISLIPILFQYIQTLINSALESAGQSAAQIPLEVFAENSLPITGINLLANGAFLSSLLIAGMLACLIDKKYTNAAIFCLVLAGCSFIGMIHNDAIALFPKNGTILGIIYLAAGAIIFQKKFIRKKSPEEAKNIPEYIN